MLAENNNCGLAGALAVLPKRLIRFVEDFSEREALEEIRLRIARPMQLISSEDELIPDTEPFSADEAKELLERLCRHSVYAHTDELRSGYVSLEGGARVGVCGKPAVDKGRILDLTEVSSFNIRIPREVKGCAEGVMKLISDGGRPCSTLIAAPPGGGKTTLLRDIVRCLSEGVGVFPQKVAVADERGELAGCVNGAPTFDVGRRTDVMDRAPKAESVSLLIRAMSPDVIVTDEIGGEADAKAILEAAFCGVSVIASAHASSAEELKKRVGVERLIDEGSFKRILLLKRRGSVLGVASVKP